MRQVLEAPEVTERGLFDLTGKVEVVTGSSRHRRAHGPELADAAGLNLSLRQGCETQNSDLGRLA